MSPELGREKISIIVPVYNDAAGIRSFTRQLPLRAAAAEIVVVDGQSSDQTVDLARSLCDRLIETERSRARQMNTGARAATGEIFWFLHADTAVPDESVAQIQRALRDRSVVGGYFRIRLPRKPLVYRLTDSLAHYAGRLLRIRCADHGFFCRHEVFEQVGGFPEVDLMEDVEFFRMLHRHAKVRSLSSRLMLSARRYEQVGPTKLTLAYGLIATLYVIGVPLARLATVYGRTCSVAPPANAASSPVLNTCGSRSSVGLRSRSS